MNFTTTGQQLYNWLDGSDRWLSRALSPRRDKVVLAIATTENLAHLPWEVLHDSKGFLVERLSPAVVPVRWLPDVETTDIAPENRPLQVLFMACSPLNTSPVIDFEQEEARILAATARQPLVLTVEESGFLQELGNLVKSYDKSYFDILHLTGHADIIDGVPRFRTETETGECYLACAEEIAEALQFGLPPLIFLSGCRTGQAGEAGAVPSMAEQLLQFGATAVLGWGRPVLEGDATEAAATLYGELAAGSELAEAVAKTYRALITNKARDWHLLRLYVAGNVPAALVTPLRTRGRQPVTVRSATTRFLDPTGKVKVANRESFVGRRRQIQSCLRSLTQSVEEIGVLIHGMGGLGKSTLAARLCDRLTYFESVVWVGRIDEASLVNRLSRCFDNNREAREILQSQDDPLDVRLRQVFNPDLGESKELLLVFDDFEDNLEARNGGFVPSPEAAKVFLGLVDAIRETNAAHRIIITCRYEFDFSGLRYFYKQPLDGLRDADLEKKCSRLASFNAKSQVDVALQAKAITLADGNPRLLEWLDKILQNSPQAEVNQILSQLEA
ncbi:MAG TPA: CHAT domain-containing protein, partial [Candidatus Obscuribacterales bacterium]